VVKVYNGLHHHVSIVKMVREHICIILFGARTKKQRFGGAGLAETGLTGFSQTGQDGLGQFFKCNIGLHHYVPLVELIEKHIWFTPLEVQMN